MTDYYFIDPDQPERKRRVQRRIEARESRIDPEDYPEIGNRVFAVSPAPLSGKDEDLPLNGEEDADEIIEELEEEMDDDTDRRDELRTPEGHPTESNTDKVGGENNSIVNKVVAVIKGVFK